MLFDIDGRLVSTAGTGRRALDRAFEQLFGIRGAFASIELPGRTNPVIVRDALCVHGIGNRDHGWIRFWDCYAGALAEEMRAIIRAGRSSRVSCRCCRRSRPGAIASSRCSPGTSEPRHA